MISRTLSSMIPNQLRWLSRIYLLRVETGPAFRPGMSAMVSEGQETRGGLFDRPLVIGRLWPGLVPFLDDLALLIGHLISPEAGPPEIHLASILDDRCSGSSLPLGQRVRLKRGSELNARAAGSGPCNPALHGSSVAAKIYLRLVLRKAVADHQRAMFGQIADSHRNTSASMFDDGRQDDVRARRSPFVAIHLAPPHLHFRAASPAWLDVRAMALSARAAVSLQLDGGASHVRNA